MLESTRAVHLVATLSLLVVPLAQPVAATRAESAHAVHEHAENLGSVNLSTSCKPEANSQVQRGLALLHHMMYERAASEFVAATRTQSDCAMGYWGQAMSFVHPLWSDPPDAAKFAKGSLLADAAMREGDKTPREREYIRALQAYYNEGKSTKESGNLLAFARGWASVHEKYPDDPDAALFHALSQLATADPSDKTFAQQRRAGALIEAVLALYPTHPGGHHYIIHAYDYPALAARALTIAREYGRIAPEVPHALHMPTHVFTRLGLWEESIAWNTRSAAAALKNPVSGSVSIHYLHALDYLVYAHLQRAEDGKAAAVAKDLRNLRPPVQVELASAYAFAAVPARIALERQRWADAAALEARVPAWYPWESAPAVEAITQFARALGAARSHDDALARSALQRLESLRDRAAASNVYWGTQVEIQRLAALAWLTFEQGHRVTALEQMRKAADLELSTEKHPVTPGEVLPARELLADMLMELGDYAGAEQEYKKSLERSPNRFNSLYGAGRAAELRGDRATAIRFYEQLTMLSPATDAERRPVKLEHARRFLEHARTAPGRAPG